MVPDKPCPDNALALHDAMQAGVVLVDRAGAIVHINQRLSEMMNTASDDLVGRTMFEVYEGHEADDQLRDILERFDEAVEREFFVPLPDGARLPVLAMGRPIRCDGAMRDLRVVTIADISAQQRQADELRQRYLDIAQLSDTVLEQALDLKDYNHRLEQRVRERTAELQDANMDAIYMLAVASEAKDQDTGAHVRRIEQYARNLALAIGLAPETAREIGYSAILHDIGKMQVPDEILKKPGPLTGAERRVMQRHTITGERILSDKPFFDTARQIARHHHEDWNGGGYPDGLCGEMIPLPARIVHLVDVFDALTSERVYKPPWSAARALRAIQEARGTAFDPDLVDAFLASRGAPT